MVYPRPKYSPTPSSPPPHGTQPCRGPLISLSAQFPADGKLVSIFSLVVGKALCFFEVPNPIDVTSFTILPVSELFYMWDGDVG